MRAMSDNQVEELFEHYADAHKIDTVTEIMTQQELLSTGVMTQQELLSTDVMIQRALNTSLTHWILTY